MYAYLYFWQCLEIPSDNFGNPVFARCQLYHPIAWFAPLICKLMYHLPFIQCQSTWSWFSSEQPTIVGHMELIGEYKIPCISKLLSQERELQHLPGNTHVNLILKLHHR